MTMLLQVGDNVYCLSEGEHCIVMQRDGALVVDSNHPSMQGVIAVVDLLSPDDSAEQQPRAFVKAFREDFGFESLDGMTSIPVPFRRLVVWNRVEHRLRFGHHTLLEWVDDQEPLSSLTNPSQLTSSPWSNPSAQVDVSGTDLLTQEPGGPTPENADDDDSDATTFDEAVTAATIEAEAVAKAEATASAVWAEIPVSKASETPAVESTHLQMPTQTPRAPVPPLDFTSPSLLEHEEEEGGFDYGNDEDEDQQLPGEEGAEAAAEASQKHIMEDNEPANMTSPAKNVSTEAETAPTAPVAADATPAVPKDAESPDAETAVGQKTTQGGVENVEKVETATIQPSSAEIEVESKTLLGTQVETSGKADFPDDTVPIKKAFEYEALEGAAYVEKQAVPEVNEDDSDEATQLVPPPKNTAESEPRVADDVPMEDAREDDDSTEEDAPDAVDAAADDHNGPAASPPTSEAAKPRESSVASATSKPSHARRTCSADVPDENANVSQTIVTTPASKRARRDEPSRSNSRSARKESSTTLARIMASKVGKLDDAKLGSLVRDAGGKYVEKLSAASSATHLVVQNLGKRTVKLFIACCTKAELVSVKWLLDSAKAGQPLDVVAKYHAKGALWDLLTMRYNQQQLTADQKGVFSGLKFYFKDLLGKRLPSASEMDLILKAGQGSRVKTLKALASRTDLSSAIIVVVDEKTKLSAAENKAVAAGARTCTKDKLLDAILLQDASAFRR